MNVYVADPHWGWWIIWYFFLGGIAAGAYVTATLIDLRFSRFVAWSGDHATARGETRENPARIGYFIAFPLICVCGVLLILDLDRPGRFWHMLFKSEIVKEAISQGWPWTGHSWALMAEAPIFKHWSPMSFGSWALAAFGLCSGLSLLGSLRPESRLSRLLQRGILGRSLQLLGCAMGFIVAAYTGALLTATNQPMWSDTRWVAPLFVTSSLSTGIAAIVLFLLHRRAEARDGRHYLQGAERWALGLEMVVFLIFLASLGALLDPILDTWNGWLLVAGTPLLALLIPLVFHVRQWGSLLSARFSLAAAACVLLGGFVLRYSILTTAPELLARGPTLPDTQATPTESSQSRLLTGFSPEDGRKRGGGQGADPLNRPAELEPRSKIHEDQ